MSRADKAKEYFLSGYNCAQAVLLAFSDATGPEGEVAARIALPFGGGMGRLRLTCGAFSGAAMVLGMSLSKADVEPENKREVYVAVQEIARRFKEENGSLICGELLTDARVSVDTVPSPEKRTSDYYKKRPCAEIVYSAAKITEEYLCEKGFIKEQRENRDTDRL